MADFHRLHCQEPWFSLLKSGIKPVEGRKNSLKYRSIRAGDRIEFYCGQEAFQADVVRLTPFATLADYLQQVGVENALPGVSSLEEATRIYLQWNTQEDIAHWGFLGIFIRPL
ncbi:ASCH domain-containing protein [Candidatus Protochlamydia phocaeensis]|uniref:ASCH domain-containing protein n=1 Tax=Candidatus Protochlamydia phocaeensis TaxID=1414722 RepID=UPI000839730E|nr:ASCH domain-containing protein [Candidatus Protochlamydia phocaeensis]